MNHQAVLGIAELGAFVKPGNHVVNLLSRPLFAMCELAPILEVEPENYSDARRGHLRLAGCDCIDGARYLLDGVADGAATFPRLSVIKHGVVLDAALAVALPWPEVWPAIRKQANPRVKQSQNDESAPSY